MVKVTGDIILKRKNYIFDKFGEEKFNQIIQDLDEYIKNVLKGVILSQTMYDVRFIQALLRVIDEKLGRKELVDMTYHIVEKQLSGFFGFVIKFITVPMLIRRASDMFKKFYSEGTMEIINYENNEVVVKVTGFYFTNAHLQVFMHYLSAMLQICTKKKSCRLVRRYPTLNTNSNIM